MSVGAPLFFDLAVEALDAAHYRVSVTSSPVGVASVQIDAPFTLSELAELGDTLDGRTDLSADQRDTARRTFGEKLFGAVFTGSILDAYTVSRSRGSLLIRLRIGQPGCWPISPGQHSETR